MSQTSASMTDVRDTPPSTLGDKSAADRDENSLSDNDVDEKTKMTEESSDSSKPSPLVFALIMSALLLTILLVSLDMTIVSTAVPRISHDFHSLDSVGWYGSAFFLTMAVFQSTWGKIYKYFDLKWSFLAAIFIFELGTLISAVSNNSAAFIAGRAIGGAGGAGVTSGVYIAIPNLVSPNKAPTYIGLTGLVFTLASVMGPLVGGAFTSEVTWRWCFYINLPLGGLVGIPLLLLFKTPPSAKPPKATWKEIFLQMDLPGSVSIISALICYLLALQWGGITMPWSSSKVIGLLVGWILLTIAFVAIEMIQGERALIAPRFLKQRVVLVCCVFIFFLNAANYLRVYYIPIYFQAIDGVSAYESGVRNLPLIIATSVFTIVAGGIVSKIGYYQPFLILGALLATVGSGLIYTLGTEPTTGQYVGYQLLAGIGDGLAVQIPVTAVQAFSAPQDIPTVTATVLFFQLSSGTIGVAAGQSIFSNIILKNLPASVNGSRILHIGASRLRESIGSSADFAAVLAAYLQGIRAAWIATIAFCGVACLVAVLAPPRSVLKKSESKSDDNAEKAKEEGEDGKGAVDGDAHSSS